MTTGVSYTVPSEVLVAHLQGEAVLLHMDTKRYYRLNDTAACIWKALERHASLSGIVDSLRENFDVPPDEAKQEAERVLNDLLELGLLTHPKDDKQPR